MYDIVIICTGDPYYPCYLVKLNSDPYLTTTQIIADHRHTFPPDHRVVKGHYLEIHREDKECDVYFVDTSKQDIVSGYCIIGICPVTKEVREKRKGEMKNMYLVDKDLHQSICDLGAPRIS